MDRDHTKLNDEKAPAASASSRIQMVDYQQPGRAARREDGGSLAVRTKRGKVHVAISWLAALGLLGIAGVLVCSALVPAAVVGFLLLLVGLVPLCLSLLLILAADAIDLPGFHSEDACPPGRDEVCACLSHRRTSVEPYEAVPIGQREAGETRTGHNCRAATF